MAGQIPRDFVDQVVARSDLIGILEEYLSLRKAGRDYWAKCPFHQEKTASFHASREKQVYHCFGCGESGNVLTFLMEYAGMSYPEAVSELAGRLGLAMPRHDGGEPSPRESGDSLYAMLDEADRFYRRQLRVHPRAGEAVTYLKQRGLSGEIAREFGLGYAPPGWDNLLKSLGGDARRRDILSKAGLVAEGQQPGRHYDRFRNRIMFPIQDRRGRVVGFGGRVLSDDDAPKYLNSPETPVFHKSHELYGLYFLRVRRPRPERAIMVEGYMDVVALAQHGLRNACAALGTSPSAEHLKQLFRLVDEVVFCFDGDEAGGKAAWRALEAALPLLGEGRQANFMFLPAGEDPDSLVRREGAEGFEARLNQAQSLSEFLFRRLGEQVNLGSLDGRARLVELAKPLLVELPAGAYREMLVTRLSELSGMEPTALRRLIGNPQAAVPSRTGSERRKSGVSAAPPSPMRIAVGLLIQHPELARLAPPGTDLRRLSLPGSDLLLALLDFLARYPQMGNTGTILAHWQDTDYEATLKKLAVWRHGLPEGGLEAEFTGALQRLRDQAEEQRLDALLFKAQYGGTLTTEEKQELSDLFQSRR